MSLLSPRRSLSSATGTARQDRAESQEAPVPAAPDGEMRNCARRTLTGEYQKSHAYYRAMVAPAGCLLARRPPEGVALDHIVRVRVDEREMRDLRDLVEEAYGTQPVTRNASRHRSPSAPAPRRPQYPSHRSANRQRYRTNPPSTHARRSSCWIVRVLLRRLSGQSAFAAAELFELFETQQWPASTLRNASRRRKARMINIVCSNFSVSEEKPVFNATDSIQRDNRTRRFRWMCTSSR